MSCVNQLDFLDCPEGWTSEDQDLFRLTIFASDCYQARTADIPCTREEAKTECNTEVSELASIHSEQENELATSLLKEGGWINGLRSPHWIWDDGTPWDFSNLLSSEGDDGKCLKISSEGYWVPWECNEKSRRFLCKKKPMLSSRFKELQHTGTISKLKNTLIFKSCMAKFIHIQENYFQTRYFLLKLFLDCLLQSYREYVSASCRVFSIFQEKNQ